LELQPYQINAKIENLCPSAASAQRRPYTLPFRAQSTSVVLTSMNQTLPDRRDVISGSFEYRGGIWD
jgi:hypothetical protein